MAKRLSKRKTLRRKTLRKKYTGRGFMGLSLKKNLKKYKRELGILNEEMESLIDALSTPPLNQRKYTNNKNGEIYEKLKNLNQRGLLDGYWFLQYRPKFGGTLRRKYTRGGFMGLSLKKNLKKYERQVRRLEDQIKNLIMKITDNPNHNFLRYKKGTIDQIIYDKLKVLHKQENLRNKWFALVN